MQGYLLPIVLAGLLAAPLLWRLGNDVDEPPETRTEGPEQAETETAASEDDAETDSLKIRSFSLGGSELRFEFSTADDLLSPERGEASDVRKTRFENPTSTRAVD